MDKGDIWEQIMEGSNASLGLPSNTIQSAFYNKGSFVAVLDNLLQEKETVKAYSFNPDIPSKPMTQLTAYMLEENNVFREALVSYELAHPEVCFNIKLELMIYEEAKPYFNGEKELSDVLEALSTKVALYEAG